MMKNLIQINSKNKNNLIKIMLKVNKKVCKI